MGRQWVPGERTRMVEITSVVRVGRRLILRTEPWNAPLWLTRHYWVLLTFAPTSNSFCLKVSKLKILERSRQSSRRRPGGYYVDIPEEVPGKNWWSATLTGNLSFLPGIHLKRRQKKLCVQDIICQKSPPKTIFGLWDLSITWLKVIKNKTLGLWNISRMGD